MKRSNRKNISAEDAIKAKEKKFYPQTLDQLMGETGLSEFGTLDENEFVREMEENSYSSTDLQKFAEKHGILASDNMKETQRKLLDEFRAHKRKFTPLDVKQTVTKSTPELVKLMADGR